MSVTHYAPLEFTQGTSVEWTTDATDYAAGWSATCSLVGKSDSLALTGSRSAVTDGFTFTITTAQSAALHAGSYAYAIRYTDGTDVEEIERGTILVLPDIAAEHPLGKQDPRSPARQRYDHYNSMLLQESFVKTLQPGQIEEIENIMRRLEWDIRREEDAEKVKRGMNATRKLYTRFQ